MSVISIHLMEGFCNRMSQYCMARGYAESHGCQLQTPFWMGQKVFELDDPPIEKELPVRQETDIDRWRGEVDIRIEGWGQHKKSLTYTREQARRWFKFRPEIAELLKAVPHFEVAAHLRWGDYVGLDNFVAISKEAYFDACDKFGINRTKIRFITEEQPIIVPGLPRTMDEHTRQMRSNVTGLGFLADFYALMQADILFRSNSTFGLWAGWLGDHRRIFSPDTTGIPARGERPLYQWAPFVEGNHAATQPNYIGCSELHLPEK
jgi:hypothetical protein